MPDEPTPIQKAQAAVAAQQERQGCLAGLLGGLIGGTAPPPPAGPASVQISATPGTVSQPGPLTLTLGAVNVARLRLLIDGAEQPEPLSAGQVIRQIAAGTASKGYIYRLEGLNALGIVVASSETTVTVDLNTVPGDTTPPSITLSLSSANFTEQGTLYLSALADDASGIQSVSYYWGSVAPANLIDGTTRTITRADNGTRTVIAVATDKATPPNTAQDSKQLTVNIPAAAQAFTPYVSFPVGRAEARNRNKDTISWEPARTITQADINAGVWGPVVTLSDGSPGVRIEDRHFRSDIPGVNALRFKYPLDVAVELRRASTHAYGLPGFLKSGHFGIEAGSDVRAYDHIFHSGKPPAGYDGASPARILKADRAKNFILDGFESYGSGGVYFDQWGGTAANVCHIRNGGAYDVDGRRVDASGNWRTSSVLAEYFDTTQFAQVNNGIGLENFIWELFEVINNPLYGAMFEDALSAHASSGTVNNRILWRDFLIEICLPYDGGVFAASGGTNPRYGKGPDGAVRGHSGTGGLAGDGGTKSGVTIGPDTISGRIRAERYTILTSYNAFTGISAGNRSTLADYIVYGVQAFRSAAPAGYTLLEKQFVGTQLIDYASGYDPALWFGHAIETGQVGVFGANADGTLKTTTVSEATSTSRRSQFVNGSHLMVSNGPDSAISGLDTITAMSNPGTVLAGLAIIDNLRAARRANITQRGGVLGVRA